MQMINFFCSDILCVLVWTDVKNLGVAKGADGVVETGIIDAILHV
jgi:hypothetical protein